MSEKEDLKPNDQKTTPKVSHVKEIKRYTSEKNKKETPKLNETQTGPRKSRGKNNDGNSNSPQTEDKLPLFEKHIKEIVT